jgi:hypothetical protein
LVQLIVASHVAYLQVRREAIARRSVPPKKAKAQSIQHRLRSS